jgi:hypothetical protein
VTRRNGLVNTVALMLTGALVGLLVVGCGIRPTGVIYGQGAPTGAVSSMLLYLVDHNTLRPVARPLPVTPTINATNKIAPFVPADMQALTALLQGPSAAEAAAGLTSEIPANAVGGVKHTDDPHLILVYVETDAGTSLSQRAVDQIACTVIAAQLIDGITDNEKSLRVQVQDSGDRSWTPQRCPQNTP